MWVRVMEGKRLLTWQRVKITRRQDDVRYACLSKSRVYYPKSRRSLANIYSDIKSPSSCKCSDGPSDVQQNPVGGTKRDILISNSNSAKNLLHIAEGPEALHDTSVGLLRKARES